MSELKKQAAEKAEFEWLEKKKEVERREIEEKEIENKKEILEQLKRDQELRAEAERKNIQEETEKMKKHEELLKVSFISTPHLSNYELGNDFILYDWVWECAP